ncbi:MAG: hypothetical protein ACREDQ_01600 [Limisphaerales bacterium]
MKKPLLITLLLASGFIGVAQAAVEAVPFRITETRVMAFGDDRVSRQPASLELTLSLNGPEAESCTQYGNLKLEAAVDDKGTNLIPAKDNFFHDPAKFKDYSNAFFRKSHFGTDQPAAPQVELDLALPARSATKIARLQGSLEITDAGTLQTIELASLKSAGKKTLAMPAGAGVSVTVAAVSGDSVRSLSIEITGDESALESVEVVDASGRNISSGMSSWSFNGGPIQKSLELNRPLDDTMKLVAKVSLNRKHVKVPFDLQNIALP